MSRTEAVERVWARVHAECGYAVASQVFEPSWDRWRWHCSAPGCARRGVAWERPTAPCGLCGAALVTVREEAVLDLEVRNAEVPKRFLNVTVRHAVGACAGSSASYTALAVSCWCLPRDSVAMLHVVFGATDDMTQRYGHTNYVAEVVMASVGAQQHEPVCGERVEE